ncbi:MAG: DUF3883 domain-containing protein [Gammaproteobacteria bacterium]|nr:DUF3883 domain-containing protein [Gammaproteobacteria bacterium]MDH5650695.1 DUF3883 domain-containing protein [Gammaproteobacteria bacterium]
MTLETYRQAFRNLRVNHKHGHASPHKVCMLLAVMDLMAESEISENKIYYTDTLLDRYHVHFSTLESAIDHPNPQLPFYHLKSEQFWHHRIKQGRESEYHAYDTTMSQKVLRENIDYAYLDDELFEYLKYSTTRELLKQDLRQNLDPHLRNEANDAHGAWSVEECELITADYIEMLIKELNGQPYNKTKHRRELSPLLNNRSDGSIEFKHQNISAVLIDLDLPYIQGYKPRFNTQQLLHNVVAAQVTSRFKQLISSVEKLIDDAPEQSPDRDWQQILVEAPAMDNEIREPAPRSYSPRIYDYTEREARNRSLGQRGEAFVLEFEQQRLKYIGRADLVRQIEWTSKEKGDGAGYDIRSFRKDGEELYIEVKTTNAGIYQPFLISDNEVAFSQDHADQYSLYRVFEYRQAPKIYRLDGNVRDHTILKAKQYQASFR